FISPKDFSFCTEVRSTHSTTRPSRSHRPEKQIRGSAAVLMVDPPRLTACNMTVPANTIGMQWARPPMPIGTGIICFPYSDQLKIMNSDRLRSAVEQDH